MTVVTVVDIFSVIPYLIIKIMAMKIAMIIRTEPHPAPIATVLALLEVLDTPKICESILVSLPVELLTKSIFGFFH